MTRFAVPVVLLALAALVACGGGVPRGFDRLWVDEWSWHNHGTDWVRGVAGGEFRFEVEGYGASFRGEMLGLDRSGGSVVVTGPASSSSIRIGSRERRFVRLQLTAGEYTMTVPPGVAVGSPRLGLPESGTRQLVFVLVDTLRADHVRADLTPGILDHFKGGRRWNQATANCSWTVPSVASMFTARPTLAISTPSGDMVGVPRGLATWPSLLDNAGFQGAAVVANYTVHTLNGFSEGFGTYLVPDGHGPKSHPDATWVVEEARRWLLAHRGEDAFLYLHLMDPHQPYRSHSDPGVAAPDLEPLAMRRREATAEEAALLRRLYADEVRHVDEVLTPFLDALADDTVVVLTSDHGEALGEHGAWGHGLNLYQEGVLVPLLVRGPGVPPGDVDTPVQLLDLGPTVLELMGVAGADGMVGRSLLAGGSPAPLVSTTFGGGPLRWAWRRDMDKVVLRMAAQPDLGWEVQSAMLEGVPLPSGGFHFDLAADPREQAPMVVPERLLPPRGAWCRDCSWWCGAGMGRCRVRSRRWGRWRWSRRGALRRWLFGGRGTGWRSRATRDSRCVPWALASIPGRGRSRSGTDSEACTGRWVNTSPSTGLSGRRAISRAASTSGGTRIEGSWLKAMRKLSRGSALSGTLSNS